MFTLINSEVVLSTQVKDKVRTTSAILATSAIFYLEGDKIRFTNENKHRIKTNNAKPMYTKSYRYSKIPREEIKSQVDVRTRHNTILNIDLVVSSLGNS